MKTRKKKSFTAEERRRGIAAILALAVRRMLRDERNSKVLSTDVSNRVELVLKKRLSVPGVPEDSGLSNE